MFCVEPAYLRKTADELQKIGNKTRASHLLLEETIARMNTIEIKGMDAVRRNLRKRASELTVREREITALSQALARISEYYSRTEQKNTRMFESIPHVIPVWERIDLRDTAARIPQAVLRYGTDGS